MELSVPVLVSADQRDRYLVMLPGMSPISFRGPSLAALLDDVALHLMELFPKTSAEEMPKYELCPEIELRKVKITAQLKIPEKREPISWTGRVSAVLERWPQDQYWLACLPRFGTEKFALESPKILESAIARYIEEWAEKHGHATLDERTCSRHERLEILNFDADLPSILPSRRPPPKKKKKKKKEKTEKTGKRTPKEQQIKEEEKKAKRELIPPMELRSVAVNLTHRAIDGRLGRAHLRDRLAEELTQQLDHEGTGILLVGASGVGKTALVHEVVRRLAGEARALSLKDRRDVWQVDGNRLIAGMSMVGAWENRLRNIVHELTMRQDILYVSDLPALVYTGRSAHSDTNVALFLEPHLARGDLRIIGECTPERLLATRDETPGFFARFRVVQLDAMSERDALIVLVRMIRELGARELLHVEPEALESVLALTRRFEANQVHPGKSVSLLARVLSDHSTISRDDLGRRTIDRARVIDTYGRQTGLPRFVLTESASRASSEIREFFEHRIIAQPKAVDAAVDVVTLLEQALNDPSRPISTFLFVGPTGVGKTETAKAIAELLFGSADRMIRFDMSELLHTDSVARLFGDRRQPDGELTRRVQQQPFSVILLDEIEKAHPSVFDALLQVLGEGRLTNAAGRTVDFTSTVIVMTSNLGVREAGKRLGFESDSALAIDAHYRGAAEKFFRPEFFNRIDRVVAFSPLGREAIAPLVARLMESMLGRRGLRRSSVVVEVDPTLVDVIIDQGFDPRYGARSIKRVLEQKLAVPLAQHLVGRRGTDLTIASLSRRGDGIDIAVEIPLPPRRPKLPAMEVMIDWTVLEQRFRRLTTLLEQIGGGKSFQMIEQEHSALIRKNAGDERLDVLSQILEAHGSLRAAIDEYEHEHLEHVPYEEDFVEDEVKEWDPKKTKTLFAPSVRAVRPVRGPLRKEPAVALEQLEQKLASLRFRMKHALLPPSRPAVLRLTQIAPDARSAAWLELVLSAFESGLKDWASSVVTREGHAVTMTMTGPGILELVTPELGYWVNSEELGPDLITTIVRVDEATTTQQEHALRYWFKHGVARDEETGVEVTLPHGMYAVAMRRIFLEMG